ncbi:MAG: cupin domain-containing protein [Planctomycetes bacterium]|nr:cupin domain-containing protein [Planctomycetota bacterium]
MTRAPRRLALALLAGLVGCAAPSPGAGEPEDGGAPGTAPRAEEGAPPRRAAPHPGAVGQWSFLASSARQALDAQEGGRPGYVEASLTRADHLEVALLATRGRVPPPARPADEVLVVIELEGATVADDRPVAALMVEGRPQPLSAGTIAVLPSGARGALELAPVARGGTLHVLVVRAVRSAGAAGGRAWVSDVGALPLDEEPDGPPSTEPSFTRVAAVGDRLGLYVMALTRHATLDRQTQRQIVVEQLVPTQARPRHDEALLVLSGEGSVGVGDGGHRIQTGSLVVVPAGLPFHLTNDTPPPGMRLLVVSAPAREGQPVELLDMPPGKTPVRREVRREE